MKKSKFFKRAGIIALSAVMTAGVALSAAACGGGGGVQRNEEGYRAGTPGRSTDPNQLTVYIFCNDADAATNRSICDQWMAEYNAVHNTNYTVKLDNLNNKEQYFKNVNQYYSNDSMYDILYLAPRFVRTYAETGSVLNLSDYFDTVSADPALSGAAAKAENESVLGQIWKNATSYYSYQKKEVTDAASKSAYKLGQLVSYSETDNRFHTDADDSVVGVYGLPKDYSNFSTSYNNLFFTDAIKKAITTTLATATRNVEGAHNETSNSVSHERRYTANSGRKSNAPTAKSIIQYAASGTYTNPYTGDTKTVTEGEDAPILNPGVPTRYLPFNFFRHNSYYEALAGGDPLALLCDAFSTDTDGDGHGDGYVVTIPGFPNDEVKVPEGTATDPNAPYDTSIGHVTYTYAEYSAFIWAMTYYLNTFSWQNNDGHGGVRYSASSDYMTVFGGEQYEGKSEAAVGTVLYLLPWLYANDADVINAANTLCTAMDESGKVIGQDVDITDPSKWREYVGKLSNTVSKMNLDGTTRNVDVQFGYNSERFLETYGAFLALASDWNANNGGDSDANSDNSGWDYFRAGRSLFYGAGSWDGATRNDTHPDMLEFGQMPTPVSEKYALYSEVKDANYSMVTYSNGATSKGTGDAAADDGVQRADLSAGKQIYSKEDIDKNQMLRQDKWGARMDSVGYAVNGQVSNYTGEHAWKKEAAVSLVMALTIDRDSQVALTYAGAQYPNFRDQMEQFVNYQDYGSEGAFKDMLTPEGFSDMKYYDDKGEVDSAVAAQAKKIWDRYYEIAMEMETIVTDPARNTQTVEDYLKTQNVDGQPVRYDASYAKVTFNKFASSSSTTSYLAYAMKVLRMIPMTRATREINIRMQYGLNAVRDSTMYTFNDNWVATVDARSATDTVFAYSKGAQVKVGNTAINASNIATLRDSVKRNPITKTQTWETPVVFCLRLAQTSQRILTQATAEEQTTLAQLQQ